MFSYVYDRLSKLDEIFCSSIVVSQFLACIKEPVFLHFALSLWSQSRKE